MMKSNRRGAVSGSARHYGAEGGKGGGGDLTPPPVQRSRWSGPGPLKCLFVSDYKLQQRPPRFLPQRRTSHNCASAALFSPRAPFPPSFFAIKIGCWCEYLKHFIIIIYLRFRLFILIQMKLLVKDNIIEKQLPWYLMKCISSDSVQPESKNDEITGLIRNLIYMGGKGL